MSWTYKGLLTKVKEETWEGRSQGFFAELENTFQNPVTKEEIKDFERIKLLDTAIDTARKFQGQFVAVACRLKPMVSKSGKAYLFKHSGVVAPAK